MDKKRIGEYLKKLRQQKKKGGEKSFTQSDLAEEFLINYDRDISINAIAEWESGKSLPSPDNLEILAKIYDRTIDEILDAEDNKEIDYNKVYFIYDRNWYMNVNYKEVNTHQLFNEQKLLITTRFKELLLIRIDRGFTTNEENEFRFLFDNFYNLSEYAREISDLEIKDEYLIFKDDLCELLTKIKKLNKDEQYWEIQKLYSEKDVLWFKFRLNVEELQSIDITKKRYEKLENWQKDMLLAMFQNIELVQFDPSKRGAKNLKRFEEENRGASPESINKLGIKNLIKGGACINKYFLNIKKGYDEKLRIIDRIEEIYNNCLKPIEIQVHNYENSGKLKTFKIENNTKNRFLNNYYYSLKINLNDYRNNDNNRKDIEDIYNWFVNNDEISEDVYLKIAKNLNIDTNREKKYWMADLKLYSIIDKNFNDFKEKERCIKKDIEEFNDLVNKLKSGDTTYTIHKYNTIGGKDEVSIRDYIEHWKTDLDYSEYLNCREEKLTKELLDEIDNLSMEEIKEKYFKVEVIENE